MYLSSFFLCLIPLNVFPLSVLAALSGRGPPLPPTHLSLSSFEWSLANANRSIVVPTPFLNQPHLALIKAGIIDDPNIGLNEGTTRWVGEEEAWTWETKIKVDADGKWADVERFYLVFNGLDTFCEIKLNGKLIGSTDNAFRSWVFDATQVVKPSLNKTVPLSLRFASAYATASKLAHEPGNMWFPNKSADKKHSTTLQPFEYSYRNWARKQQSDFGWDWGPAYLPSGPVQPAYLIGLSAPDQSKHTFVKQSKSHRRQAKTIPLKSYGAKAQRKLSLLTDKRLKRATDASDDAPTDAPDNAPSFWVHSTTIDIYRQGQENNLSPDQGAPWVINITLPITSATILDAKLSGVIPGTSVKLPAKQLSVLKTPVYRDFGPDYSLTAEYVVDSKEVELWYPATLGNPTLYDLELTLQVEAEGQDEKSKTRDDEQLSWREKIGFRTIVVDQSRYSKQEVSNGIQPGTRFTFIVNGKPFYVQGSSMIPIDNFAARTNSTTIRWLIESALLAHQNVIRIWGGGAYQTDEFYDICDELGILAWSESVFACGAYPLSPKSFLDNIRAEVSENVARLNRHPSTALWAGNNEGEGYLIDVNRTWTNGSIYFNQYDHLNNHVLRELVLDNTRSISYIPSSTTQGYLSLDPYVARYYNSTPGELYGDKEHYNYNTSASFDISSYPVARFVNEFGFHSMPSIYTWDRVLETPEDYDFNSTVIRAHEKHNPAESLVYPWPADDGQEQLTTGVTRHYPTPNITGDYHTLLAQWSYSTQVFQAAFMASEIHYYRLGASRGEKNMGALYWQLNDVWEGQSWSSIEYTGRWKIFHYLAERVQSHVIISPIFHQKNNTLDIYVTSDLWQPVEGTAEWTWYDFAGRQLAATTKKNFSVSPIHSTQLYNAGGLSEMVPDDHPADDAWMHLSLTTSDGKYTNEQFFHPVALKDCKLRPTKVQSRPIGQNQVSIEVTSGGVATWVNVEHPPGVRGYFKDMKTQLPSNDFFLRPDEKRHLEFVLRDQDHVDLTKNLESKMVVRTLWDNQHHSK
ncbi:hypothetical protein MJO28_007381 [Puccinia striiformis f. sp. tritici]|uniref:Uncharacterized protein n=1 Tax=Puccinia striiformis f. sp. tritici TaxID=168172 RepID=A0ACC0EFT2_9BASI|nr:hypothetical protein Pst134EA_013490 [Puccinia striiformis f. sp. tritici]KAH9465609.1 hypothetical protein Pst134EA_013490 [Puccinia striiformis f. sp. tritici]KAI7951697.1 hypothetical protein MJO28_007381 [Puccinia striiformis f. sp. tritici]